MRRWLTILLLFLLPLQSFWAAAAGYCRHESAPGVAHVGHHEHRHSDAASDAGAGKADSKAKQEADKSLSDDDCSYCHLSSAKPLRTSLPAVPELSERPRFTVVEHALQTRGAERRERPNWMLA